MAKQPDAAPLSKKALGFHNDRQHPTGRMEPASPFDGSPMTIQIRSVLSFACLILPAALGVAGINTNHCHAALVVQAADDVDPPLRLAHDGRLRELMEAVQTHHIQPPTRQQMIFDVLNAFAKHQKSPVPAGFSAKLSAENDIERLYALMQEELSRSRATELTDEQFDNIALHAVADATYGGLDVIRSKDHNVNEQLAANRYVGIGIQVSQHPEAKELLIQRTMEGGTAEKAGIVANDVIESVDGRPTKEVPLNQVVDWLRGPEGTTVKVTVRNDKGSREIEIVRRVTPFKTVHIIRDASTPDTAVLRPDRIGASTVHEMTTLISELPETVKHIVVDLRSVTSGSIHHLHLLADALMEEGTAGFVETRTARREVKTEAGTLADNRTISLVYIPRRSSRMDWLAATAATQGVHVFRENSWKAIPGEDPPAAMPGTLESFPIWKETYFVELNGSRLLLSDNTSANDAEPFGELLNADNQDLSGGALTSAWRYLAGPQAPVAVPQARPQRVNSMARPDSATYRTLTDDNQLLKQISKTLAN